MICQRCEQEIDCHEGDERRTASSPSPRRSAAPITNIANQNSDRMAATMDRLIASLDSLHQTLHVIYAVNPVPSCDYECCRDRKASNE